MEPSTTSDWVIIDALRSAARQSSPSDRCWVSLTRTGGQNRPFLLPTVEEFFMAFCLDVLREDFVVRLDLPDDVTFATESPMLARVPRELNTIMDLLREKYSDDRLYPFSLWIVPRQCLATAVELIEAFQYQGADGQLFTDLLVMGVSRLAVQQSSLDLSVNCERLDSAIDAVVRATQSLHGRVKWAGDTPESLRGRHPLP